MFSVNIEEEKSIINDYTEDSWFLQRKKDKFEEILKKI